MNDSNTFYYIHLYAQTEQSCVQLVQESVALQLTQTLQEKYTTVVRIQ